jgi:hypothetical protein
VSASWERFSAFEARNAARRADEARALFDNYAHYRQTMELAEEQVEEVQKFRTTDTRTGEPQERYVFEGVQYATRREAEAARHEAIIGKAREFYMELDKMYLSRRGLERTAKGTFQHSPTSRRIRSGRLALKQARQRADIAAADA